jgi:hypothetical protein
MVAREGLLPGGLAERLVELTAEGSCCTAGSAKVRKASEVGDAIVGPATCTPLVGAGSIHLQQALSACWPWHRGQDAPAWGMPFRHTKRPVAIAGAPRSVTTVSHAVAT